MKRLVSISEGELEHVQVDIVPTQHSDMILLKSLDGGDVKNGRCPSCKYAPLDKQHGYYLCKNCHSLYKVYDDNVYLVQ